MTSPSSFLISALPLEVLLLGHILCVGGGGEGGLGLCRGRGAGTPPAPALQLLEQRLDRVESATLGGRGGRRPAEQARWGALLSRSWGVRHGGRGRGVVLLLLLLASQQRLEGILLLLLLLRGRVIV